MKKALLRALRIIRNLTIAVFGLFFLAAWLISLPFIQNKIAAYAENILEGALGTDVEVGRIELQFPFRAAIKDLTIYDDQHQVFIHSHNTWVSMMDLSLWQIVFSSDPTSVTLGSVTLDEAKVNLYKQRRDGKLNLSFLTDGPKGTGKGKGVNLSFHNVRLRESQFLFRDSTASDSALAIHNRFNGANLECTKVNALLSWRYTPDKQMIMGVKELTLLENHAGIPLDGFKGEFTYGPDKSTGKPKLVAQGIELHSGATHLAFDASLDPLPRPAPDGHQYQVGVEFHGTEFNLALLRHLTGKNTFDGTVNLDGRLKGDENHLHSDSIFIATAGVTRVKAAIDIEGFTSQNISWKATFAQKSVLSFDELQSMIPGTNLQVQGVAGLEGSVVGNLDTLFATGLRVNYGRDTYLDLMGTIVDYRKGDDIQFNLAYRNSYVDFAELKRLLPVLRKQDLPPEMDQMGRVYLNGVYTGGVADFDVKTDFVTRGGSGETEVHFVLPPLVGRPEYEGNLVTHGLNVDELGISRVIRSSDLNFTGHIKGKGFKFSETQMLVSGMALNSDFWNSRLDSVYSDSLRIDSGTVTGTLRIGDKEGNASFYTETNLISSPKVITLRGDIADFDINHYTGLPGYPTEVTTVMNIHIEGDSIENYTGKTSFENMMLVKPLAADTMYLRRLTFRSDTNTTTTKNLTLKSSLAEMKVKGRFNFKEGTQWISRIVKEAGLYVQENDSLIEDYYARKELRKDTLSMALSFTVMPELQKVLQFFELPVHVSPGSMLNIDLSSALTDNVVITYHGDSVGYSTVRGVNPSINFTVIKDALKNSLLGSGDLRLDSLAIGKEVEFQKIVLEPTVADNSVEYWLTGRQESLGNRFKFNGETIFLPGGIVSHINPNVSGLDIGSSKWRVKNTNKIIYSEGELAVRDLFFSNGDQTISIKGVASKDREDKLAVAAARVPIPDITALLADEIHVGGVVDTLTVTMTGVFDEPNLTANGNVSGFEYGPIDSVDISLDAFWESRRISEFLALHTVWYYQHTSALELRGNYDIKKDLLDFQADSSSIPLEWLAPFVEGSVSNLRGRAFVNQFTISGNPKQPRFNGEIVLNGAGARLNYLGAEAAFEDRTFIRFNNDSIHIPGTIITDAFGKTAELSGAVYYAEGKSPRLNLHLHQFNGFTLLNTTAADNEMFYGRAIAAKGDVRIKGNLQKIAITADVTPGEDTKLEVPISYYNKSQRLDFVHFVNSEEPATVLVGSDLSGFELNLLMRANTDASIKLIFDEQVGDLIEAKGEGDINLIIDSDGEFKMTGNYKVAEGNYTFTAENIANKKFEVKEGGSISWGGTPYDAVLNLDAVYNVNANLSDLIGNSNAGRIPVEIIMHLRGSLLSPIISLELSLNIDNATGGDMLGIGSYFRNIQYDEQELNRQVVSLLLFRRFAPRTQYFEGSDNTGGGGGITSGISELISNQLNYWISQAFNTNLGVEVNTDNFDNIIVGLKASLFDERVTIERNGVVAGNRNGQVSIGNVTVLIKLLPEPPKEGENTSQITDPRVGQLVMEIFNRENAGLNNTYNNTTGAGIFYKKDFDRLVELFGKKEESEIK